ncbi:MAG: 50S ribosomal protein L9 [Deltaproteobacteria bacterium]|nr:MAG: 50S ribosomal protein L9 [Deltaproteobacteria bacterium]RLB86114.1 MAG: 50S ribosomal protein L9 [Deltaproteobacteria bacterium]
MKVILTKDMHELGLEGDILEVANGYARNYLLPKGFALEATPRNLKLLEGRRKKIEARRLKAKEEAEQLREKIESIQLSFVQKAGEEGKLYGSVTAMDIAEALEKQGIVVDRRKIVLDRPIKEVGEFEVKVKIYPEVTGNLKVTVEAEGAEEKK